MWCTYQQGMKLLSIITFCALLHTFDGQSQLLPRRSFELHRIGNINVEVYMLNNETGENVCTMTFRNMTSWERDNIITFYEFTSAFNSARSSLSWIPCSQEKCDSGFNYRLFRAVTYSFFPACCHGYTRTNDDNDCPIEIKKRTIVDALDELGATAYLSMIKERGGAGVVKMLTKGKRPLTIFYLDDDNMSSTSGQIQSPRRFIKSHVVAGLRYTDTFSDEEILTSLTGTNIRIRFILDGGVPKILANCVALTGVVNHVAHNGVIHQIKQPITTPSYDLMGWLKLRNDLSSFYTALKESDVLNTSKPTSFTIFAPRNGAFNVASQQLLADIFASPRRLSALLRQHITDFSICDVMLDSNASPCTLIGNRLAINRTQDGVFVNNARLLESNIITTNGVIHVIDAVFIPEQALLIPEVLPTSSMIASVVEDTDVLSILSKQNITFLAPNTEALQNMFDDERSSENWRKEVINDHIIYAPYLAHDFSRADGTPYSHFEVPQLEDDENMSKLRRVVGLMKLQCGRVTRPNIEAFNGHVHEISKILVEPFGTTWDVLTDDPIYSIFVKLIRQVGLESVLQTDQVTVFVPINQRFHELPREDFQKILGDKTYTEELIRYHIATERLCESDIRRLGYPPPWYWYSTGQVETYLGDRNLRIVSMRNVTIINDMNIIDPDIVSSNGVIHVINGVLKPPRPPPRFGVQFQESSVSEG